MIYFSMHTVTGDDLSSTAHVLARLDETEVIPKQLSLFLDKRNFAQVNRNPYIKLQTFHIRASMLPRMKFDSCVSCLGIQTPKAHPK